MPPRRRDNPDDRAGPPPRLAASGRPLGPRPGKRPPLRVFTTTLWEYPSQHYDSARGGTVGSFPTMQGDKDYAGATPSWIIWQLLTRYTREGDTVLDPMSGSGTTLDVATDLGRKAVGFDLAPAGPDIRQADARRLPAADNSADFVFIDPPYSTHIEYSDDARCIGRLDAAGPDGGRAYYQAMTEVIAEIDRVLKDRRYMALYVSDSWRKRAKTEPGSGAGVFMPIGFELFSRLAARFRPVDIIAVVRHNQKLAKGHWHKSAEESNSFLRGFNYLFIMKKERTADIQPRPRTSEPRSRSNEPRP